ncbi:MAG: lytic transglycosylase domain-containing protein [Acidobacteriota bacterium]
MKLFRKNKWLRYIFELELLLIFSIITSFLVTTLLMQNNSLSEKSKTDLSGLFEKYRIFSSINDFQPLNSETIPPIHEIKNPFVRNFMAMRSASSDMKDKSYGVIDDFIRNFKSDDPFLNFEKDKLHLKNLYVKKRYPQFIQEYKKGKYGFKYDMMLLLSLIYTKDEKNSLRVFEDLYLNYPIRAIRDLLPGTELTGLLNRAEPGFWNKKLELMIEKGNFSEFSQISRYIKNKQLINYISAEINYSRKRYSKVKYFLTGIRSARFTPGKEKLLLKMRVRDDDYSDIDQTLEKLMSDKDIYKKLLLDLSSILLIKGELELSSKYFTRYITYLRGNEKSREYNYWNALWVTAWLKVKSGDEKSAAVLFGEGSKSTIIPYRIANTFWSSIYNGKEPEAIEEFPFTYYFARYSDMKNSGRDLDISYFINMFNKKGSDLFFKLISNVKHLLKEGLFDEALEYLSWVMENTELPVEDMNSLKMVETLIYLKKGDHYHTFVTFRNNFKDYEKIVLPCFLKDIYMPMRYRKLVKKYSNKSGVIEELVFALIKRESMFRENIISPAKAKGLMQLMDRTASMTARNIGLKFRRNDIYKPEINIRLGVAHLKELLEKYDGKIYLALAAYNAGSHRVAQWLKEFGRFDENKFIEMIPFSETRNYVKNVLRNYYYYKYYYKPAERGNIRL